MTRYTLRLAALLLAWSLAACGVQSGTSPGQVTPAPAATAEPASDATPAGDTIVATLNRTGGIAGVAARYTIQADGDITLNDATAHHPDGSAAARRLAEQIAATGIYAVPPGKYQPEVVCCDLFSYTLTLNNGGERYEYITSEGIEDVPPPIFAVIGLIEDFARDGGIGQ